MIRNRFLPSSIDNYDNCVKYYNIINYIYGGKFFGNYDNRSENFFGSYNNCGGKFFGQLVLRKKTAVALKRGIFS